MTNSYIVITNDDGVESPGILALKQGLERLGEVIVFAPDHNWSAAGHTKTLHKPLRVDRCELKDGHLAYTSSGAPSDCVALALLGVLDRRPDLIVSGINKGENVGHDITYSGTVAGAMEGVVFGLPAIAVSLASFDREEYGPAATYAAQVAEQVLEHGLPPNTFLNVNVPALPPSEIKGVRVTRLGRRFYRDELVIREDPRGRPYYWIGGKMPSGDATIEGTDIWALANGCVSVTPLHMDMTDEPLVQALRQWNLE